MRILSSALHAQLDYIYIVAFILLAKLAGWGSKLSWLLVVLALASWIYSLLTRYELGPVNLISLRVHLAIDIVSGLGLIAAAFLWPNQETDMALWLVGVGLFEIIGALITETEPQQLEQQVEH